MTCADLRTVATDALAAHSQRPLQGLFLPLPLSSDLLGTLVECCLENWQVGTLSHHHNQSSAPGLSNIKNLCSPTRKTS